MFEGAIVVSLSRTQGNVSLSSTEAGYVPPGVVTKGVLFVWEIVEFLAVDVAEKCTTAFSRQLGYHSINQQLTKQ